MRKPHSDSAETARLLDLAAAGDETAFDRLFERYRPIIWQTVDRRLGPRVRARVDPSDVVQETHIDVYQRLGEFLRRRPMPFRLWVLKTAHERLLKIERYHLGTAKRSIYREVPLPDSSSLELAGRFATSGYLPSSRMRREELARQMRLILGRLSRQDREIILLRNFDSLSNQEAACLLELSPEAAKKRYTRALLRLQQLISQSGLRGSEP